MGQADQYPSDSLLETKVIYYSVYAIVIQKRRNGHSNKISEPYSMKGDLKKIIFYLVIFFSKYLEKWNKEFFSEGV